MKITWIGQSGYILKSGNIEIIIDPYLSDIVNRIAGRERLVDAPITPKEITADAVICTHNHLDHLDTDAVAEMRKNQAFITTSEGKEVISGMGFENVKSVSVGETFKVGDVEMTAVYANHTADTFGIVVKAEGLTLYFSSDTLYDEKLFDIAEYKPDVTFICINGKLGNMNVDEAVVTAKKIGAKVNVPTHYGMFASNTENPELFTKKLDNGFIMEFNREYDFSEIL